MPLKIVRNDITKIKADAIVNSANPEPQVGYGTDSAIFKAAGKSKLLREREKIGRIDTGTAVATPAFSLPAKYIIHTVGPVWIDGKHREIELLSSCYTESLKAAESLQCESVAFPLISTGTYGFPKDRALQTAISVFSDWLLKHEMLITLVVFDRKAFELSGKVFQDVDAYIDENYVKEKRAEEHGTSFKYMDRMEEMQVHRRRKLADMQAEQNKEYAAFEDEIIRESLCESGFSQMSGTIGGGADAKTESLEDLLSETEETFQERLLHLIDERKLADVDVYKRANMDRKLFSKIRCNREYHPSKKTALSLAIAMELNMEETEDLLQRAELALSPSNKADLIISWFIRNKKYNIIDINLALFDHKLPTLDA